MVEKGEQMNREEIIESLENIKYINAYHRCREGIAIDIAIEELKKPKVSSWIPVADRLPNMEEYLENDGRFILDDGNRRYQGLFDIYDKKFKFSKHLSGLSYELIEDNCVIAWQPLPEPYKAGEHHD